VNATSTVSVRVEGGGEQVVAHVGLHALGSFADRLSLGEELSAAVAAGGDQRLLGHDRGKVLTQVMLMLAGGGECCGDIEYLRAQPGLFGPVPSDSTVWRTFGRIDEATLAYLAQAMAAVRSQVWSRSAATTGVDPVALDIDASLVEIHSENKEGTAPSYKGGYGFHPMFCFADATGEALAGRLRPGNAAANSIDDHLAVADEAIAQLRSWHRRRPPRRRRPCHRRPGGAGAGRLGGMLDPAGGGVPGPQRRLLGRGPLQPGGRCCHLPSRRRRGSLGSRHRPGRRRAGPLWRGRADRSG